ncbi:diaminopimelate decarboxylase, partial [Butyricicoccus sp. 1XD8-22]
QYLQLLGLHCHIGSQIFETDGFSLAAGKLMKKISDWKEEHQFECTVLNLGGGFGIRYTNEDQPLEPQVYVEEMIKTVQE